MTQATVYNPETGERKVVTVGDPNAFAGGFKLEEKAPDIKSPTVTTTGGGLLPSGNQPTPETNQADIFNKMMMSSLQSAQGVNTVDLLKKKRDLERSYLNKAQELTPEENRQLNPTQQNQMRNDSLRTISGQIDDNAYQLQKAETAITNWENTFQQMTKLGQEFTDKMVAPDSVIQSYKLAIEQNPENLTQILASAPNDKTKNAIMSALDYTKMGTKDEWEPINVQKDGVTTTMLFNKKTNEMKPIDITGQETTPSTSIIPQDGEIGGQCGDYTHTIADNIPAMGNTWESKMAIVNTSTRNWEVGDMLIQKTNLPEGHVSIVTAVDANGNATVTESNYGLDEKVGTRTITKGDPSITGVYRGGKLKTPQTTQGATNADNAYWQALAIIPKAETDTMLNEVEKMAQQDPDAYNWAMSIQKGDANWASLSGVDDPSLKTRINNILTKLPPPKASVDAAEKMIADLEALKNDDGLNASVGNWWGTRWNITDLAGSKSGFLGSANMLVSKKALDKLIEAKSQGATFGALSDREMNILSSAATKLGTWEKADKNGKVKGYDTTQTLFKEEIDRLMNEYKALVNESYQIYGLPPKYGSSGVSSGTLSSGMTYEIIE